MNPTDPTAVPQPDGVTPVTPPTGPASPVAFGAPATPAPSVPTQQANPFGPTPATPSTPPQPSAPVDPVFGAPSAANVVGGVGASIPGTPEAFGAPANPGFAPAPPAVTPSAPGAPQAFGTAPTAPTTPGTAPAFGGGPLPPPVPPSGNGSNPLLKLLSARFGRLGFVIGGFIVLALLGAAGYLMLSTVSAADYRAALQQYNKVADASSDLKSDVTKLSTTLSDSDETAYNDALSATDDPIAALKSENMTLKGMKASKFGESGKLYNTFNDKLTAYLDYGQNLITSVKNLRPAMLTCGETWDKTEAADRIAGLRGCVAELKKVTDIPDESFKTYITAISSTYADYADAYEGMTNLSDPYGDDYDTYVTYRDKLYDIGDKISADASAFMKSLNASDEKYSVKDSADAYSKYLEDHQK